MQVVSGLLRTATTQAAFTGVHWRIPPSMNAIHHAAMKIIVP